MMNPFVISPGKQINHESTTELVCPVCGRSQLHPGDWRFGNSCDEAMDVPLDDAPPEIIGAFTGVDI
jgi:hypothetical protein